MSVDLLIIGKGVMGSLHAKYAEQLGVNWNWYDPYSHEPDDERRIKSIPKKLPYSHVIIATPASTHATILTGLKDFEGRILAEKPGVMERDHLHLLDDDRVCVGLVERFNPAWDTLFHAIGQPLDVIGVDFVRCSARPVSRIKESSFVDVGLHDLDLFLHMFSHAEVESTSVFQNGNTFCLTLKLNTGEIGRFIWSNETFHKEREIRVRQRDCNYTCNLIAQTVKRFSLSRDNKNQVEDLYVEKASPIRRELEHFFSGQRFDSQRSHELFFSILESLDG